MQAQTRRTWHAAHICMGQGLLCCQAPHRMRRGARASGQLSSSDLCPPSLPAAWHYHTQAAQGQPAGLEQLDKRRRRQALVPPLHTTGEAVGVRANAIKSLVAPRGPGGELTCTWLCCLVVWQLSAASATPPSPTQHRQKAYLPSLQALCPNGLPATRIHHRVAFIVRVWAHRAGGADGRRRARSHHQLWAVSCCTAPACVREDGQPSPRRQLHGPLQRDTARRSAQSTQLCGICNQTWDLGGDPARDSALCVTGLLLSASAAGAY